MVPCTSTPLVMAARPSNPLALVVIASLSAGASQVPQWGSIPEQDYGAHLWWEGWVNGPVTLSFRDGTISSDDDGRRNTRYAFHRVDRPLPDARRQLIGLRCEDGVDVSVLEHPGPENQYTAKIRIGADVPGHVAFELLYHLYPRSWFDAPIGWWQPKETLFFHTEGPGRAKVACGGRRCRILGMEADAGNEQWMRFKHKLPGANFVAVATQAPSRSVDAWDRLSGTGGPCAVSVITQPSAHNAGVLQLVIASSADVTCEATVRWKPSRVSSAR